ncbi:MAG: DNA-directed RNA polymerase subunit omega [Tissierellia bacterium]|jgi:DNA-directed RNA polymerase subunit omega|nr:DNA-directed RNA polymerase subunit omega [Bacillota bacterium]NLK57840.1 DNA-directed RNA polymerase subunit omega [Tissierellia bacterium]
MNIPSFKDLEEITSSRYAMVNATAKRARKIVDGSQKLIETDSFKPVSIAIEEILEHKVEIAHDEPGSEGDE